MDKYDMTCEDYLKIVFQNYKLICVLSDKNNCKTLRLRHNTLGRDMVLHQLSEHSGIYEFLSGYRCPNLPEIYDTINLKDGQIVLEEYIEGLTIAQVMETGRYSVRGAKVVLRGVCNALDFLHSNNIVHRDIKPENIVVTKNGRVVLLDFNASRYITPEKKDTEIMGTVGYVSPELISTARSDARADIYSMGILLNVMITGNHPCEIIPSGQLGRVIKKCTAISPDERYQSVKDLCDAL
ncbi:MAG: serine/threonine protein kinase [Ruminococcus sp.]|nr:serine/threonine protein kinase [Ruminococcus sp.]